MKPDWHRHVACRRVGKRNVADIAVLFATTLAASVLTGGLPSALFSSGYGPALMVKALALFVGCAVAIPVVDYHATILAIFVARHRSDS